MSQSLDAAALTTFLGRIPDPESGRPLAETGQLRHVTVRGTAVEVEIALTTWAAPLRELFRCDVAQTIRARAPEADPIDVQISDCDRPPPVAGPTGLRIKSLVAVAAGKGGVGKSTVAACLALALQRAGGRVGLMDADVYGPSLPQLLGVHGTPAEVDGKIEPIDCRGIPVMSIGFMLPPDQAVIWRGPMLHSAVTRFLRDTRWGELDYLIIDMPPGTGDIALTLSQTIPVTGAVIVCTPQPVALADAVRAAAMFEKVKIPVLGVIENMSTFVCPDNGKRYDIFGHGGARAYAAEAGYSFLGELPIHIDLRARGDQGETAKNFDDPLIAPFLQEVAERLVQALARRAAAEPVRPSLPVLG